MSTTGIGEAHDRYQSFAHAAHERPGQVFQHQSVQAKFAPTIMDFLTTAGTAAELLHLPDYGVFGNGHGLIYEKNSDQALQPVLR